MTTRRRRESLARILRLLGQADQLLANGEILGSVCRTLGNSESLLHRWRTRHRSMNVDDTRRLKELEAENATLKRLLADSEVEKAALKEIAKGKW